MKAFLYNMILEFGSSVVMRAAKLKFHKMQEGILLESKCRGFAHDVEKP